MVEALETRPLELGKKPVEEPVNKSERVPVKEPVTTELAAQVSGRMARHELMKRARKR
jgi:hypothetical protein